MKEIPQTVLSVMYACFSLPIKMKPGLPLRAPVVGKLQLEIAQGYLRRVSEAVSLPHSVFSTGTS